MNITHKALLAVLAALFLFGCASTERFQRMMDDHIGSPIEEVRTLFGYNHIISELDDGLKVYTWTWVESGVTPGYSSPTTIRSFDTGTTQHITIHEGTYFPPQPYKMSCEFSFIVDQSQQVVSWRAHGEGCWAYRGPGQILGPSSTQ